MGPENAGTAAALPQQRCRCIAPGEPPAGGEAPAAASRGPRRRGLGIAPLAGHRMASASAGYSARMDDPDATVNVSGRRLAQYAIVRQVGAGAMGMVYEARDTDLDRRVAIKLLKLPEGEPDDAMLGERFLREARTAAQLTHPNVAVIYQVGRQGGVPFIAMEWLEGVDLARRVATHGPLPWAEAVAATCDAAAGLAAAHALGLVHRDIKPSNLMQTPDGTVKVVDFGLARFQGAESELTIAGSLIGTPSYMSPEQCSGGEASAASDQYALACTLFFLLCGRPPFEAPYMAGVLHKHIMEPMPDVRDRVPDVPEDVVHIVMRGAAKQPEDRFPDTLAMLNELRAVLGMQGGAGGAGIDLQRLRAVGAPTPSLVQSGRGAAAAAPAGNLPEEANSFVGREELSARALELLGQSRLLTLTGPGGTGKTRLSLQLARELAPDYPDGAWFVDLATVPAGDEIAPAMAAALGVPEAPGRALAASLVEHLRTRQAFVVLDNCEQVVDSAAATAAQLLAAAPRLHLLATSRQALGVPGETVLGVPPLALPEGDHRPDALMASEAGQLFVARARAVRADFAVDDSNADAVAEVCRRLDGIPLAIELAAARIKVLSPAQIASRLGDAFKLLTGGQRSQLPRQQTLRALIDWSYDLLEARHRQLFQRLAVFSGGFDLEAAEAVLPDDEADGIYVLDDLSELVDRSLVVAGESGGEMRYRLLQTMRQYAAEQLGQGEQQSALQRRHTTYYARLVQQHSGRLNGPAHAEAMTALTRDADNARAALDALTAQRDFDAALPLASALATYWLALGVVSDGVARIEKLLALQPPPTGALALLLYRGGALELYLQRRAASRQWFERGLELARSLGDDNLECELLRSLGNVAFHEGDLARATAHYLGSIESARKTGNRRAEAAALNNLAAAAGEQRLYAEAKDHLRQALQVQREIGRPRDEAEALRNLALVEFELGNPGQAQGYFDACVRIHQAMGDHWGAAYTLWQLGRCKLAGGDLAGARESLQRGLEDLRGLDDRLMVTQMLDQLAIVLQREGIDDEAARLARRSLALRRASENPVDLALSMVTFAELNRTSDPSHSARLLGCAAALRERLGSKLPARKQAEVDAIAKAVAAVMSASDFERLCTEGRESDPDTLLDDS